MHDDPEDGATGRPPRRSLFAWYFRLIEFIAGTTMGAILAIMVVQVAFRYLFNGSLIWAEQMCRILLVWQTFLLLGLAFRRGEFVALEILPFMLSARSRLILKTATMVPVLVFLAIVIVSGWDYAERVQRQTIPAFDFIWTAIAGQNAGISVRWVYISVPVGAALLALHVIADLIEGWLGHRSALDEPMHGGGI